jgi:hypothetical protein
MRCPWQIFFPEFRPNCRIAFSPHLTDLLLEFISHESAEKIRTALDADNWILCRIVSRAQAAKLNGRDASGELISHVELRQDCRPLVRSRVRTLAVGEVKISAEGRAVLVYELRSSATPNAEEIWLLDSILKGSRHFATDAFLFIPIQSKKTLELNKRIFMQTNSWRTE